MGDIVRMYRQIWIHPSQRNLLRIVWFADQTESIKHYELNTVTFGTSCEPFLATHTINQIANENQEKFPQSAEIMRIYFYVDVLVFGVDSVEEEIRRRNEIRLLLAQAGMTLSKISSNSPLLLQDLPSNLLDSADSSESRLHK